ncbi:hypothetical protein D5041_01990 [Verminephrobacter aporrectodeae subsp. tuberculatae]|uniref:hypothetical protein n=1 Tax=Verminephrobacter aporrectodeae TaxID=1110389 RepID=UPI0022388214|nr:hypothetical protein [Verminephrobacter aporrectodeae]MCW5222409.1 hypothetical protein [Verminephrobacter aporrectodeae subsp. tuberculatae]MCW5287873.1 hypothetical protein [Verminephrobacter aporrectodeae subsp. tuberculatae]
MTIFIKDNLRAQVEAASGGAATVMYTAAGHPCYMSVIPRFKLQDIHPSLGQGVHPAFIVNGIQKNAIYIGQYQGIVKDSNLLSIPGVLPNVQKFDYFHECAKNNGAGWHMMTHAEWAAIALWSWKNGTLPRGNTDRGKSRSMPHETGRGDDDFLPGLYDVIYTGSGPASWRHNGLPHGIADLTGNTAEWLGGLRLNEGEIQILPNNDAADNTKSQSADSAHWRAISASNGALVAPGTAGTLKYDAAAAVTSGRTQAAILSDSKTRDTTPPIPIDYGGYNPTNTFKSMGVKAGLTVPAIAKALGLYPVTASLPGEDGFLMHNQGESLSMAGGHWNDGAKAGVFARALCGGRTWTNSMWDIESWSALANARIAFVL